MSGIPFASLTAAAVTERRTNTLFPGELEHCAGQKGCPVIAGAGARTKRIAGLKNLDIYALALYVDPAAARSVLQPKLNGVAAGSLAGNQALFDELMAADGVEKTLRIVITSKLVKQRNFLEALEERLEPPLKQAGELAALEAFKRQFDDAPFRKGFEVTFDWRGPRLVTKLDGKQVGSITNRQLARALLEIYIGRDPASRPAKESIGQGLADIVLG
ncbi:hypothetical protein ABPG77_007589 [Micractinium sp. CCAP 211/92]